MSISPVINVNIPSCLSSINERLSLALASARQVAFDWAIPDDRLYFSGAPAEGLKNILDTTKQWHSSALPYLIHENDLPTFHKRLHDALKGIRGGDGSFYETELRLKDAAAGWRWVSISGKVVERDVHGRATRMVGAFSDIDERKRTESKFVRLRDLYATLSQTNQAIVRIDDRDALFQEICRIAVEHGRFQLAWIGVIDAQCGELVPVAAYGSHLHVLQRVTLSMDPSGGRKEGVITTALRNNRPGICNEFSGAIHHMQGGNSGGHAGFGSVASFPFQQDGAVLGAMNLHAADRNFFDDELIKLLEEMTHDISFALHNFRREAQRKEMEATLVDSAQRYRQLVDLSPEAIVVCRDDKLALLNQAACRLLGARDPARFLGRSIFDFVHPHFHSLLHEHAQGPANDYLATPFVEQVWQRVDGSHFDAEVAFTSLSYNNAPAVQVVVRDISERKRNEALQLGQNRILNMVATGSPLQDILLEIAQFIESRTKRGLCSILQLEADGKALSNRISPSLPRAYLDAVGDVYAGPCNDSCGTAVFRGEPVIVTDIANDPLWFERRELALQHGLKACSSWPIFGKNRKILGTLAMYFKEQIAPSSGELQLFNICANLAGIAIESRASDEKIRYLAHYDGLTSLPNRFLFKEYLDLALRKAQRHENKFAVFFLDLDHFKEINDNFGHEAGDQVLQELADRLRSCLRHTDKIARMGGDEFYVLIEELQDSRYVADVAQKLLDAASRPVLIGEQEHRVSVSIGISIFPEDGHDGQTLLKNADAAMYIAKEAGKNGFRFYSQKTGHPTAALMRGKGALPQIAAFSS
jgi:diguanylate cyclase (GGDEF)-like protein/PAS domain S-box-containing protein